MDKIEKEILRLVQSKGKSADKMTSAFKFIGDGSMEDGIKRFAKFFSDSGYSTGYSKGQQNGLIKGVGGALGVITIAVLSYQLVQYIKQQIQKNKELEKKGHEIIAALESIPDDAVEEENKTCQGETKSVQ